MPTPPRKITELTREQLDTWAKLRDGIRELEDMVIIAASYASDGRTAIAGEKAELARKYAHQLAEAIDTYRAPAVAAPRVKRGAPVPVPVPELKTVGDERTNDGLPRVLEGDGVRVEIGDLEEVVPGLRDSRRRAQAQLESLPEPRT